ncbi:endonuclease III [Candidatus Microgenomates bacterium]|nr:endonuclease III [Candidatus Microgenomates bacterium]
MDQKVSIHKILEILKKYYPHAKIVLNFKNDWELLVAVILSAQCTDKKVNEVTAKLWQKYKTLDDYVKAEATEFEKDIHSTGFYHAKAKNILATAKLIKEKFGGKVPKTMEELVSLSGVARKTANVVLGNAFNIVVGIAVDTHVSRVSQRLGLTKNTDPVKIEKDLMSLLPKEEWFSFTYRIIDFGREICVAKGPFCSKCPLNELCPSAFKIPNYR